MNLRPLDTLLAFKAIALAPELSNADRLVAAALVDHFNRRDGRCDPSIPTLAELLQMSPRSIIRALYRLNDGEIVFRDRHAGHHQCNSYEPNWEKFAALNADWTRRRNALQSGGARTELSPDTRQSWHLTGDKAVTQTSSSNLSEEPVAAESAEKSSARMDTRSFSKGQARREEERPWRGTLRSISPREAAEAAAVRRWNADLLLRFKGDPSMYGAIVDAIDEDMQQEITAAEVRRHGDGLRYILEHREQLLARAKGHG